MKTILENLPNWVKWIPAAMSLSYLVFIMCLYTNAKREARENPHSIFRVPAKENPPDKEKNN